MPLVTSLEHRIYIHALHTYFTTISKRQALNQDHSFSSFELLLFSIHQKNY